MSIKNDGHYFCGAGGNIPDGSDEALTTVVVDGVKVPVEVVNRATSYVATAMIGVRKLRNLPAQAN
ncbi:DUF4060 family protein [Salmonella enterica subsp. enterica serovar Sandiego]|nr:DUF4060 family protein [Salmonella enterica subsp. enterica serovar Sandiego]